MSNLIKTTYNGQCLDDVIAGFHTLSVNGRQFNSVSATFKDNTFDGSSFISRRVPQKTITVSFMLKASSRAEMRERQDALNKILNTDPAEISFSDETGMHWCGMFTGCELETGYQTARSGTLTFTCPTPFRYSDTVKSVTAAVDSDTGLLTAEVVNDGNVAVPIDYEVTFNHESGYLGIVSENGAIEYGNINETDDATGEMSETLLDLTSGSDIKNHFNGNNPITTGSFAYGGETQVDSDGWLYASSYGSGSTWHGAGGQITIPQDSNGDTGSKNFKIIYKPWDCTHKTFAVKGDFEMVIGDEDGNLLCDLHFAKGTTSNNNGDVRFKIAGQGDVLKSSFSLHGTTGALTQSASEVYFSKTNDLFEVYWQGKTYQYRVPALADKKACTINIFFGTYGTSTAIYYQRLKSLKFIKTNVAYYYDIPNRYQSGDVLTVDGDSAKMYVNGNVQLQDEVLGSEYFKAEPGTTKIEFSVSSFCTQNPTVKALIREAWL